MIYPLKNNDRSLASENTGTGTWNEPFENVL